MPDAHERLAAQVGHHFGPEGPPEARVAEHGGHVYRDRQQEALHAGGVAEQPPLEFRDARQPFRPHAVPDPAPQRGRGVVPEVEAVAAVDALQQQLEFHGLGVVAVAGSAHGRGSV